VATKFIRKRCLVEGCGGEVRMDAHDDPICLKCGTDQATMMQSGPPPDKRREAAFQVFLRAVV